MRQGICSHKQEGGGNFILNKQKISLKSREAILFDFEGTLVDFQWNLTGAVRETLAMLKAAGFNAEKFSGLKYSTLMLEAQARAAEAGLAPAEVRERISAVYDRYDADALARWSLRPKADAFLAFLKTVGIKTGLVSNVGKKALQKALAKLKLEDFFDVVISRVDVANLKPHPEGIRTALDRLGVPKEKALFIGDSLDDIQAAQAAGVKALIILGGENKQAELLAARADLLFNYFEELLERYAEEMRA
jgi:HAD superfamily hydrolase (TIGR01509 family)